MYKFVSFCFVGFIKKGSKGRIPAVQSPKYFVQVGAKQRSDNILWNGWGPKGKTDWCDVASPLIICH